jgi:hypothetical protein
LVVDDVEALFFVGGRYLAALDVSALTDPGDVAVGTGFQAGHAMQRRSTRYEDLTVRAILAPAEATAAAQATATTTVRLASRSVPDPAECDVEPRSLASVAQFAGTPETDHVSLPAGKSFTLPPGDPVDRDTAAAITAATRTLVACMNAGDWLRYFALLTDDGMRHYNATFPLTDEALSIVAATPVPVAEPDRIAVVVVLDVRVLADERIGALIELDAPSYLHERREIQFLTFVEEDGRFLLDEATVDLEDQFDASGSPPVPLSSPTPSPSTPTPATAPQPTN